MAISKSTILFALIGMTTSGFGGIYTFSLQKIKNFLNNELLGYDESHDEDWKILQTYLNKSENYEYLVLTGLDQIQSKSNTNPETGIKLKNWCQNTSETNVSINKNLNTIWRNALIDAASKFCILPIERKLENPINFEQSDSESFLQSNLSKLKESNQSETLNDELKQIRNIQQNNEAIKDLKDWCGSIYTKGYNNPQDLDWILAQKYCQKTV